MKKNSANIRVPAHLIPKLEEIAARLNKRSVNSVITSILEEMLELIDNRECRKLPDTVFQIDALRDKDRSGEHWQGCAHPEPLALVAEPPPVYHPKTSSPTTAAKRAKTGGRGNA